MTRILTCAILVSMVVGCQGIISGGLEDEADNDGEDGSIDDPTGGPDGPPEDPATDGQLALAWSDNSDNEVGFIVERRLEDGGSFSELSRPGAGATSYTDDSALLGVRYCYRVAAYNGGGRSGYTAEACAAGRAPS